MRFRDNDDFSASLGGIFIKKLNGSLLVSTPDGKFFKCFILCKQSNLMKKLYTLITALVNRKVKNKLVIVSVNYSF